MLSSIREKTALKAMNNFSDLKEEIQMILHMVIAYTKCVRGCTASVIRNCNLCINGTMFLRENFGEIQFIRPSFTAFIIFILECVHPPSLCVSVFLSVSYSLSKFLFSHEDQFNNLSSGLLFLLTQVCSQIKPRY